jgi:ABC-type dipeptide/oligopeptide/nickel transport system permease component
MIGLLIGRALQAIPTLLLVSLVAFGLIAATPVGIILPTLVLAVRPLGRQLRLIRATTLDALALDHLTVARAKGLARGTILARHVLPNAILPLITVIGLDLTALVSSAVIVESVFAWPGVGRLAADAALAGDVPVLMAFVLLIGAVVVSTSLIVDVLCRVVDPRQRPGPRTSARARSAPSETSR